MGASVIGWAAIAANVCRTVNTGGRREMFRGAAGATAHSPRFQTGGLSSECEHVDQEPSAVEEFECPDIKPCPRVPDVHVPPRPNPLRPGARVCLCKRVLLPE